MTTCDGATEEQRHVELLPEMPVDEKALTKLKILTPLSVLVTMAINLVFALAVHPTTGRISDDYLTPITPHKCLIGIYWLVLYVLQIGFAILVCAVRKEATKGTIVKGVGLRFVFAQFLFMLWPIFFHFYLFPISAVLLILTLLILLTIQVTLLPTSRRATHKNPLDYVFIHAPMRMWLLALWNVGVWQVGGIALGWDRYAETDTDANDHPGQWEKHHNGHVWIYCAILLGVGLINAFATFLSHDPVVALSTIYISVSILVGPSESDSRIVVPLILLSALQAVALASAWGWKLFRMHQGRREGKIRLPQDGEDAEERAGN